MCGKSVRRSIDVIANRAGAIAPAFESRRNIKEFGDATPGTSSTVIGYKDNQRILFDKTWGYDIQGNLVYNARSESYMVKPSFMNNERCAVPVGGFYEGGILFSPATSDDTLFLAGLSHQDKYVVLTQPAELTKIATFYHRAPIILSANYYMPLWLEKGILPDLNNKAQLALHESLYRI